MSILGTIKTFFIGKTLYFPGCVTKYKLESIKNNYLNILEALEIDVITLENEFCCGLPALNKGYTEDFERLRHENIKLFKKHNISKIITNCPACANIFKKHYNITTQHITEIIPEQEINEDRGKISYHAPCHLKTETPKQIIKSIGFQIQENTQDHMCCGAGHIDIDKPLSKKIAENRLKHFPTSRVITTCPLCYKHLKDNADEKEIIELSEVIMR